jgi:hypothetical protein
MTRYSQNAGDRATPNSNHITGGTLFACAADTLELGENEPNYEQGSEEQRGLLLPEDSESHIGAG